MRMRIPALLLRACHAPRCRRLPIRRCICAHSSSPSFFTSASVAASRISWRLARLCSAYSPSSATSPHIIHHALAVDGRVSPTIRQRHVSWDDLTVQVRHPARAEDGAVPQRPSRGHHTVAAGRAADLCEVLETEDITVRDNWYSCARWPPSDTYGVSPPNRDPL
jgi:hypothetical protein